MKIGLGTVQFGLDYGLSNANAKASIAEVKRILGCAAAAGISTLDTAPAYGSSEEVLGQVADTDFRIVTKTNVEIEGTEQLTASLEQSLRRLRRTSVYGLLLHRSAALMSKDGPDMFRALERQKEMGRVTRIGVSIYHEDELLTLLKRYPIDLVQLPLNVFDQRMLRNGTLERLKDRGIEVHARSVFLQGLLLMAPEQITGSLAVYKDHLRRWRDAVKDRGVTPLALALGFALSIEEVDVVLCGVNARTQLEDILEGSRVTVDTDSLRDLSHQDACLLNPTMWRI